MGLQVYGGACPIEYVVDSSGLKRYIGHTTCCLLVTLQDKDGYLAWFQGMGRCLRHSVSGGVESCAEEDLEDAEGS